MGRSRAPRVSVAVATATPTAVGVHAVHVHALADPNAARPGPRLSARGVAVDGVLEARDRVCSALVNSGLRVPDVAVDLMVDAEPPTHVDSGLDLPIAAALLAATGQLPPERLEGAGLLGELGLDGAIRPVHALADRLAALARVGIHRVIVPTGDRPPTRLIVWGATHLREVAAQTWTEAEERGILDPGRSPETHHAGPRPDRRVRTGREPLLRPGELRARVLGHLRAHPDLGFTPTNLARAVGRPNSRGAVINACRRLVADGLASRVHGDPQWYQLSSPSDTPAG